MALGRRRLGSAMARQDFQFNLNRRWPGDDAEADDNYDDVAYF